MPAVQYRLVSWRPSLHHPIASIPDDPTAAAADDPCGIGTRQEARRPAQAAARVRIAGKPAAPSLPDDEDDDDDDEEDDELDDDEDDEDLVVFTAKEAAGALATVYRFVRPFLKNYKKVLTLVGLGVLVETLFNVIMPLSLKFLIDDALGEEDFEALVRILSVLAVAGIITSIVAVWYERWDAKLASSVISDVRLRLFEHVQNLPSAYFGRTKRGEILSRFSIDLSAFEGSIKSFANSAALPFLELIAGIILMLFLNWQLAAVALLVFPITLIGPRILTPKAVQANYEQKLNESALLGMVQENIAAQAVVKAFSLQRRTLGWFTMRNNDARRKIAAATFLSTMVERTVTISVLLLHLVVLALGAYLATKGQITIGTFVTFESAFWEVSYNIAHIMHFIPVSIQSAAAVRHIEELLDEPTRGADRPGAPDLPRITNDITFDRVTFQYEGSETPVLDSLSLKLDVGKSIAIVGPSGSGKSTLLNLILRLYVPDEGRVTIDGVDIRRVTRESLRQSMAVVFQENMLFNMSIRENIRLGKEGATDEEVEQAARKAEIHRYIMSLPQKIRHLGRRARRYAVRRPAPAHRDRARDRPQSLGPAAGRGDLGARPDHGSRDQPHAAQSRKGPHHDLLDPSPDLGGRDGRDHRDFRRQGDRARLARKAAGGQRRVPKALGRPEPHAASARPVRPTTTATTMMMTRI